MGGGEGREFLLLLILGFAVTTASLRKGRGRPVIGQWDVLFLSIDCGFTLYIPVFLYDFDRYKHMFILELICFWPPLRAVPIKWLNDIDFLYESMQVESKVLYVSWAGFRKGQLLRVTGNFLYSQEKPERFLLIQL